MEHLVQGGKLARRDAPDLDDAAHVLLVERLHHGGDLAALLGELDTHRTAVGLRALMIEKAQLDELVLIVARIGAEKATEGAQLGVAHLLVTDIVEKDRLDRSQIAPAPAGKLVLDDVVETPVGAIDQGHRIEIGMAAQRDDGSARGLRHG